MSRRVKTQTERHKKLCCDNDTQVDEHIAKGCPKEDDGLDKYFRCSLPKCKNTEVVQFLCNKCQQNFCVGHRLPQDHNCEKLQEELAKSSSSINYGELKKAVRERINALMKQVASQKPTAKKVDMMKMKSKAVVRFSN